LNDIWAEDHIEASPDLQTLLAATTTKQATLTTIATEYVEVRGIQDNPTISSALLLAQLSGDMSIENYGRQDARNFVQTLLQREMRTTSIRRRLNCLSAIFNYAFAEYEIDGRNPFTRVLIAREGADRVKRLPVDTEGLQGLYEACLTTDKPLRWAVPILGETGCRIAEVIGLRRSDVSPDATSIKIIAHSARRLKTSGSERELPLVGYAQVAMQKLINADNNAYLFPTYLRDGEILATHAGNTLNKWLKQQTEGKTAHCLRHAFRDRLRAVECPIELLDALGGWSAVQGAGRRYGAGFTMEQKRLWLKRIAVCTEAD
jgi:integrase